MKKLAEVIVEKQKPKKKEPKHIFFEFQDFAYRLASDLNDLAHRSLYFRLAKREKREVLQKARDFAIDYPLKKQQGSSRAKIFMWSFKMLKEYGKIPKDQTNVNRPTKTRSLKLEARNPKSETNPNGQNSNSQKRF